MSNWLAWRLCEQRRFSTHSVMVWMGEWMVVCLYMCPVIDDKQYKEWMLGWRDAKCKYSTSNKITLFGIFCKCDVAKNVLWGAEHQNGFWPMNWPLNFLVQFELVINHWKEQQGAWMAKTSSCCHILTSWNQASDWKSHRNGHPWKFSFFKNTHGEF